MSLLKSVRFYFIFALVLASSLCADAQKPLEAEWTVIKLVGYDSTWGEHKPTIEDTFAAHYLGVPQSQIHYVALMDSYGAEGSYYVGQYAKEAPESFQPLILPVPEVNMADPGELIQFVNWALQNFPSKKVLFSIWGHGNGVALKVGANMFDSSTPGGLGLSVAGLRQVLEFAQNVRAQKIDMVFSCTCYFGSLELAYEISDTTRHMIAGAGTVGCGLDPLSQLIKNPKLEAKKLGHETLKNFVRHLPREVVYAAIDLEELQRQKNALRSFFSEVNSFAKISVKNKSHLRKVMGSAQHMNNVNPQYPNLYNAYVDWTTMLGLIQADAALPLQLRKKAIELKHKFETKVIYAKYVEANVFGIFKNVGGISIYLPHILPHIFQSSYYQTLRFDKQISSGALRNLL